MKQLFYFIKNYQNSIYLLVILALFFSIITIAVIKTNPGSWLEALDWFDPRFLHWNLGLILIGVLNIPCITYFYINLKNEKKRRICQELPELPPEEIKKIEKELDQRLDRQFHLQSYLGSMILLIIITAFGLSCILLLKPVPIAKDFSDGLNYGRGANIFLLGPFIEKLNNPDDFYHQIIISLTGFMFGFLGAYFYFINYLVRSFFTLDLTSYTYVYCAARMAFSSILALVLSFAIVSIFHGKGFEQDFFIYYLPVLSFFVGFFPSRGLLFIEKLGSKIFRLGSTYKYYNSTSLDKLPGMSANHEIRLDREGFDNLENLSHACAFDLAIRTGFGYRQLEQWIGQAWLRTHLGPHYEEFEKSTGITSRKELLEIVRNWESDPSCGKADALLERCLINEALKKKLAVLCVMLNSKYSNSAHE